MFNALVHPEIATLQMKKLPLSAAKFSDY